MSARPPAMLFYFKDFMTDGNVLAMTTEEKGAYLMLLCQAWEQEPPATIPNDDAVLARWCGLSLQRFRTSRNCILRPFLYCLENDRYEQKRLKREYERAVNSMENQSRKGKSGAEKRWNKDSTTNACAMPVLYPEQCLSITQAMPGDSNRDRDNTSSFFTTFKKEEVSPQPQGETKPRVKRNPKPEVSEKAKQFAGMWYDRCLQWGDEYAKRETREHYITKAAPLWDKEIKTSKGTNETTVTAALNYIEHHHGTNGFSWKGKVYSPAGLFTGEKPKWPTILNQSKGNDKPVVLDMWDEPVTDEENEKGKEYYRLKEAQERMQEGEHDLDEVSGDDDITPF